MAKFVVMRIEKYISALLYRYQCVTVPGFGAFLTEVRPAMADSSTYTFYPPKKAVSFNANVKNNDGLLANHIATQQKISYAQAVEQINAAVASWKQQLDNLDVITLKNIGDFGLNAEGSLVFNPVDSTNYLTSAFGLASVVSSPVKREVFKAEAEELEEKAPVIFTPERKRSYSYLKYAAVFAVIVGVGGAAVVNYRNAQVERQTLAVEKSVQQKVQQRLQDATFLIKPSLPAVTMTVEEAQPEILPYHIIAGAYKSEANADKAVAELKAKGFKSERLAPTKYGLHPVTYSSFATRQEANAAMKELHKITDPGAWVLTEE
jgi:nucleoid DNA-binding protein/cell division septation protein DedD